MKKKIIIISSVGVVVLGIILTCILVFLHKGKTPTYRLLKIYEVEGSAVVTREGIGEIEPYKNMVLESGDRIQLTTGKLVICADEDKYIYLEEDTELVLTAEGTKQDSKTTIDLVKGGITNEIQNKLSDDSTYEINTPNSTMSVRGTIYRVYVYEENGIKYTRVTVFQGHVVTRLRFKDGTLDSREVSVLEGKEALIYEDGKVVDYVFESTDIVYDDIPDSVLEFLLGMAQEGEELSITDEEIKEILAKGPFTVTFMYNGSVFGKQTVARGEKVSVPSLKPAQSGSWDFDFNKPITENTTIEWK